ncbi:MAG: hypothetical protein H6861_09740 [Rhodospirillales bacterium]|nr:hypothetical protein [Rhodospirillales bacterium]
MDMYKLRLGFLCLAVLIYGAWGSPTPDAPGVVELAVGVLLALAIGADGLAGTLMFSAKAPLWFRVGQAVLVFGLSAGIIGGILAGHDAGAMARDLAALGFMVLPLLLCPLFQGRPEAGRVLVLAVVALGLLFALRARLQVPGLAAGEALYYLANMPSVLFAAVFLAGSAMMGFVQRFTLRSVALALVFMVLAGVVLWPLAETQQRASLGVFALSMACLYGLCLWCQPRRALVVGGVLALGLWALWPEIGAVVSDVERKTALVGGNMRFEEWRAVWEEISEHPPSLLLGQGWGAHFSSPAVADIRVNYTHGLLSSLLLKTGIAGLGLGLVYLAVLARAGWALWGRAPVVALALAGPLLIDVFLYASFKSLDFGLVLSLVAVLSFYGDDRAHGVETDRGVLYPR